MSHDKTISSLFTDVFLNRCLKSFVMLGLFFNKVVGLLLQNTYGSCFWIFAAANTFFQLNLACIEDERIGFCPGLLWEQELNLRSSHCIFRIKKRCSQKFCKFHRKTPILKSLFNKVADQETQTQMFSCGVYEIFKNLRTTASETCCFTWSVLLNKLHFGSN